MTDWVAHFEAVRLVMAGTRIVPLRTGGAAPERFTAKFEYEVDHTVELDIVIEDGAPALEALHVFRSPERGPLTKTELRRLPLTEMVASATDARSLDVEQRDRGGYRIRPARAEEAPQPRRRTAITDEHLRAVAQVYRDATDGRPGQAVERAFSASTRTASRWITLARRQGLLDEGGTKP